MVKAQVFVCVSMEMNKESNVVGVFDDIDAMREGWRVRGVNPFVERCRVEAWPPNGGPPTFLPEFLWMPQGMRNGFDTPWDGYSPTTREEVQARRNMFGSEKRGLFHFGGRRGVQR